MSGLRKGDKVRVEFEGEVSAYIPNGMQSVWDVEVRLPSGTRTFVRHEHVKVVEPDYEVNVVYVDKDGEYFIYWPTVDREKPWFEPGSQDGLSLDYPTRPLRKLVPEG